ncbi:MAG: AAA family ATPase [Neisseriaceae bacterium]
MEIMNLKQYEAYSKVSYTPFNTGINIFDEKRAIGLDDFTVIAGSSGSCKSTVALYMVCSMAKAGSVVVFINTENAGHVMQQRIENLGFDFNRDFGAFDKNGTPRLIITTATEIKFDQIVNMVQAYKPQALFLDLFSALLDNTKSFDIPMVTRHYAKALAGFNEKYKCAVFVTEQLVKDSKRNYRPNLNDIQGGVALTQKATKVILIYRYLKENLERLFVKDNIPNLVEMTTEIIVRKDRYSRIQENFYFVKLDMYGFSMLNPLEFEDYSNFTFTGNKK